MAWLIVPNEWWSVNETYNDNPYGQQNHIRLNGYHNLTLDPLLTDAQRWPTKIKITYSISASIPGNALNMYWISADYTLSATGMTSIVYESSDTPSLSVSDTIERDLTLDGFFGGISLSYFVEAYGAGEAGENDSGSAVISAVELYYEEVDEFWQDYRGVRERSTT